MAAGDILNNWTLAQLARSAAVAPRLSGATDGRLRLSRSDGTGGFDSGVN